MGDPSQNSSDIALAGTLGAGNIAFPAGACGMDPHSRLPA